MKYERLVRTLLVRTQAAEGQALAEYGLILGLVFVAAAIALALMSGAVTTSITSFVDAAGFGGS